MKLVSATAAALLLTLAPAWAVTFNTIYKIPAALDDGSVPYTGVATTVTCTNLGTANVDIRFDVYKDNGGFLKSKTKSPVTPRQTYVFSTHLTNIYGGDSIATGKLKLGMITVLSTNNNVVCTAAQMNASSFSPYGVPLHMLRLNPISGTVE